VTDPAKAVGTPINSALAAAAPLNPIFIPASLEGDERENLGSIER
jgi:hypothetical protein